MVWSAHSATFRVNGLKRWSRGRFTGVSCALLALVGSASTAEPPTATEGPEATADKEAFLGRTVVLPPYVVSATRIDQHPWRYGCLAGFEVLTRASDGDTDVLLDGLRCHLWMQDKMLPEDWLPQAQVPYTVIADNTDPKSLGKTELYVPPLTVRSPADAFGWGLPAESIRIKSGYVSARDHDTRAVNTNLYDVPYTGFVEIGFERLYRCAPPLPPWLTAGLVGEPGLFTNVLLKASLNMDTRVMDRKLIFRGVQWISLEETERLQKEIATKQHRIKIPFIPLGRIFTEPPPREESRLLWESEAALFVRWGVFDPNRKGPAWKQSFLQFVQRARSEPVTEPMFAECFGCGFGAMEKILSDYLNDCIGAPVTVDLDYPQQFPEPELPPATADQIGRILGDWLRMHGDAERRQNPGMSAVLLNAAGRMLMRAYQMDNGLPPDVEPAAQQEQTYQSVPRKTDGPVVPMRAFIVTAERIHDPGLLAVFGLYEHDIGDDGKAREFLEKAVQGSVVRPTADVVLAQLRYAEAVAKPLGHDGKLSATQAAFVLEPAQAAIRSSATAEAWDVIVRTLARCEAKPSALDIERIVAGVSRFPQDTHLILRAAQLCIQSGNMTGAAELIDKSLVFVTDEDTKRKLEKLLSSPSIGGGLR
ncbi:MAG TPA: hypothetical protein VLW52_14670 [Opitutaceae bacterium]|nr:hypothetical protein [Opitutaceae bacterium]